MTDTPTSAAPRLFGITATEADAVAILRRGPSDWSQVGRWDTHVGRYEPGSWLRGKLFVQRCDLSPDGRWLAYMAFQSHGRGPLAPSYLAVSHLPWLHALAAWRLDGTWSRGCHFTGDGHCRLGAPDQGELRLGRFGLAGTRAEQFAVERRRGWTETPDTPMRDPDDPWDMHRKVRMSRPCPRDSVSVSLEVEGNFAAFREGPDHREVRYRLRTACGTRELPEAQWADWTRDGQLVVATWSGDLQQLVVGDTTPRVLFQQALGPFEPDPRPPPDAAQRW